MPYGHVRNSQSLPPEGFDDPKDFRDSAKTVLEKIKRQCPRVTWKESFARLGRFDVVDIVEATDPKEVEKSAMIIRAYGHASTETLVATHSLAECFCFWYVSIRIPSPEEPPLRRFLHSLTIQTRKPYAVLRGCPSAESDWAAYHLGLWRGQSLSQVGLANAEIPTGGAPFRRSGSGYRVRNASQAIAAHGRDVCPLG